MPTSKIEKLYDFKNNKKIWDDIVIKKREYFSNILYCYVPNIIGNRKVDK